MFFNLDHHLHRIHNQYGIINHILHLIKRGTLNHYPVINMEMYLIIREYNDIGVFIEFY